MASKSHAESALRKFAPGATLVDNSGPLHYDILLEAPPGHSWGGDMHAFVIHEFNSGNKSDYWRRVIEDIQASLDPAELCGENCVYWSN